jgi:hypothetical protein
MNEHEALVEWYWQGKRKYSEKNLFHFVHHKSHADWPGIEPESSRWAVARPRSGDNKDSSLLVYNAVEIGK